MENYLATKKEWSTDTCHNMGEFLEKSQSLKYSYGRSGVFVGTVSVLQDKKISVDEELCCFVALSCTLRNG